MHVNPIQFEEGLTRQSWSIEDRFEIRSKLRKKNFNIFNRKKEMFD